MKILLTGFVAFNNDTINPSEEILKNIDIDKVLLPVSYNKVEKILDDAINKYQPDFVLSLGYASSRKEISIEKYAYNEKNAKIKDNDGILCNGIRIKDDVDKIETNIEIDKILNHLEEYHIYQSEDPGRFICNEVYYLSLLKMNRNALFIHIPPIKEMKEDGKDLSFLISAIKEVIKYINGE